MAGLRKGNKRYGPRTRSRRETGKVLGKWGRGGKGIWRAIAQEVEGKASPALEERGLCPKR